MYIIERNVMSDVIENEVVKKKVVRKRVVKLKVLKMKGGGNNRGIGKYVREYILKCVNSNNELDVKVLDNLLFKKFGVSKSGSKSRIKSIRWYINDMKENKLIG